MLQFKECPLCQLPANSVMTGPELVYYEVQLNGRRLTFRLRPSVIDALDSLKPILADIRRIILTGNWPFDIDRDPDIEPQMLIDMVASPKFPKGPEDTLRMLFTTLYNRQNSRGGWIEVHEWFQDKKFMHSLYIEHYDEVALYFRELEALGWLEVKFNNPENDEIGLPLEYRLTYKGLKHYIDMMEDGPMSRNCFIAMSFGGNPLIASIRMTIRHVLTELRYTPLLVDEVHLQSDQTINDGIIALIKRSKFAVCDFTEQKNGVYFEAGYAAGRKMPVIYTCHVDHFKQSHFDTNHFAHIVYTDVDDLAVKLKNKIEAWITE